MIINIFNFFLFLLSIWFLLTLSYGNFSLLGIFFGILFASLAAIASYQLKLIHKNSEFIYMSFGFYRHFLKIIFKNFYKSVNLILKMSLEQKSIRPLIYKLEIDIEKFNPTLLIATINFSSGLFCINSEIKENRMTLLIHALDEKYFKDLQIKKILKILPEINENNLI